VKSFDSFVKKKTWDRLMMSDLPPPPGRRVLCFLVWIERQKEKKYDLSAHRLFLTPQAAKLKLGFLLFSRNRWRVSCLQMRLVLRL
jgi:hypothetical protein